MENNPSYFYHFLEPISDDLSQMANGLEKSIYSSPQTMLMHARTFVEAILQRVMIAEQLSGEDNLTLKERIDLLEKKGLLEKEVLDALHQVRMNGNSAAHETRNFRYSEALLSWEAIYLIVRWYVKKYSPQDIKVPAYQDPEPRKGDETEVSELEERLQKMEALIRSNIQQHKGLTEEMETAASSSSPEDALPGLASVRTIVYKDRSLEVPHFLRDAFLLPQRFEKSESYLSVLGAEEEVRVMSELPNNLEGLHEDVEGFSEEHDEMLFTELKHLIKEETARREVELGHPGKLILFYKSDYVIVTDPLANISLSEEEFDGHPSLFHQLQEDQIERVGQLPKDLATLTKYDDVGLAEVEELFGQLKGK
ncbi:hypothetical protein NCCP2222_00590 [Sporosarcina sp. NCCP-2222]|uniref:DUF4145 domain-containing protein n=1 Tax=Sporosarcina sp. NCCP-2222 TaxID=2935073 RepID=UPI0020841824|nr:DUF4145 domain-containing protein [Sporosarcina sp. NCCP-2222]GKV54112.1 hypothetical protein NCCP2222_00590 [Sporosarcina sp. NCCP-2222]